MLIKDIKVKKKKNDEITMILKDKDNVEISNNNHSGIIVFTQSSSERSQ